MAPTSLTPLTPNEVKILDFIRDYVGKKGYAPTYQEIKDKFGFASFFSVQRYLKQLESKGYIRTPWDNKKRALELIEQETSPGSLPTIPFLGMVAAGAPIEAIERPDLIEIPSHMVRSGRQTFALKVKGQSMIEDGIQEGDVLVIQKQATAHNGQTVVALIDNEATVKRFYQRGREVELRPANPAMKPMFFPAQDVSIAGVVVGLLRDFP